MSGTTKNIGIYVLIFAIVIAMSWFYRGVPEEDSNPNIKAPVYDDSLPIYHI